MSIPYVGRDDTPDSAWAPAVIRRDCSATEVLDNNAEHRPESHLGEDGTPCLADSPKMQGRQSSSYDKRIGEGCFKSWDQLKKT